MSDIDVIDDLTLTRATDDDWDDIIAADARAFAMRNPLADDERDDLRRKVADDDVVVVRDPSLPSAPLVGVSMFYRMSMTLPGGAQADAAGLSWVSVAATHRRRGILRRMLSELRDQWLAENQTFAILTASEGTIYERFGFGPACFAHTVQIASGAQLRAAPPAAAQVRFANADEVAAAIPDIHRRWTATRPGALARTESWWTPILADRSSERPPAASGLHYLLHEDGYASYRVIKDVADGTVRAEVEEVVAVTDAAHTELWRVLASLDLIPTLRAAIPVDDPLPAKMIDLRAVEVTGHDDKMWVRILDIPTALTARRYRGGLDVVLGVEDRFAGQGGVFALTVSDDGIATVTESSERPSVRLDVSVLSSIYLGGLSARGFAAAGRLWTDSDATLDALDRAFSTAHAPFAGTFF
ncbi:GNAT family N-acetyltransferase [Gordonia desulfuricans]|uniref:GNAT family N-acetyltransferase n=1 Tax=Gordonia desulfuricans TaxID=89051 RepID=A0A7K3LPY7_9ACTN|nr:MULTISPECIES: GNAT family N-acetyltransferase [Gordonia]EMP13532.2 acetyltransferase [Gordonia sp. NB41Y]NDK90322.1 GNAT family N-acetyltransferase [Gordonia desulfuricans]WLP89579.1 GNAT family N-acetyltransferase [Gordonia sp. NB41Y]